MKVHSGYWWLCTGFLILICFSFCLMLCLFYGGVMG